MIRVPVTESSQVAQARRQCVALGQSVGFDEMGAARVALVATELATNLVKHSVGGEILAATRDCNGGTVMDLLALDKGPGMHDVEQCLTDGHSTAGSAGTGLGAIVRQAQDFDITSQVGLGTAIYVCLSSGRLACQSSEQRASWGAVCLPKTDEPANGDAYSTDDRTAALTFLIADGLGHGMAAADASVAAVQAFFEIRAAPLPQIIARAHEALRSTRGAAVGIARIDPEHDRLHFAGIGNIAATVVTGEVTRKTVSLNGTVGHQLRRIQAFDYPFAANSLLVMHSDGLVSSWTLERYPGIQMRHPALIAGVLYRDYTRGRDDVTVLVARRPRL